MANTIFPTIKATKSVFKQESTTEDILNTQFENLSARLGAVGAPVDDRGFVGRALNLEQNQGFFMDILEVIDRPGQAVKGALVAGVEGTNPFTAALEGIAGKTDQSGLEFLTNLEVFTPEQVEGMDPVGKFIANIGVDILTDPLTYIPAGSIKKVLGKLNPFEQKKVINTMVAQTDAFKAAKLTELNTLVDDFVKAGDDTASALVKARKQLGFVDDATVKTAIAKNKKQIQTTRKQIETLKAQGKSQKEIAETIGWKDWELLGLDDIDAHLAKAAEDMKIAGGQYQVIQSGGQSAPGKKDLSILLDMDGGGNWVEVGRIQVKKATSGARGASVMMKGSKGGVLQFADNVTLNPASQELLKTKYSAVQVAVTTADGTTVQKSVADIVTDLVDSAQSGKTATFTLNEKAVGKEGLKTIQEAAKEVLANQGWDYMYVIAKDGSADLVRFADIADDINVTAAFQISPSKGTKKLQTRLQIGLQLDTVNPTKTAWDDLLDATFKAKPGTETITRKVGFLTWAADRSEVASKALDLVNSIRKKFNPFYALGDETKYFVRRMSGESQVILTQEGRRIASLSEEAIKRAPNGNQMLQELVEAGARVVDGQVTLDITKYSMSNIYQLFSDEFLKYGEDMFLPIYGGRSADNVLFQLNSSYKKATGIEDAFQIIQKGDSYFINLKNVDADTFRKTLQSPDMMAALDGVQLGIGRKQLSAEAKQFAIDNNDLLNQYKKSYDDIIELFRKELGPESLPDFFKTSNGYSRHILSREGRDFMKQNAPLVRSKYVREGVDMLANRKYLGTTEDINKAMKAYYDISFDFFDPKINNSLADLLRVGVTKRESSEILNIILKNADEAGSPLFQVVPNKASSSLGPGYKYIDDFSQEFSKMYKNLSPEAQKVFDAYLGVQGYTKGSSAIAINDTAYELLKKFEKSYTEVPEMLKGYDKIINEWKGLNLITPSFHLNNFFGNTTNMYLAGMGILDQGTYLTRSGSDLRQYNRILDQVSGLLNSGMKRDEVIRNLTKQDQEVYRRLLNYMEDGVSMKSRGARDLGGVQATLEEGGQKGLYRQLTEANFNLAENADELQRYALYSWAYDKEIAKLGKIPGLTENAIQMKARGAAANKVFESLFDYSHFTRFEQDVMKRLIPFYTFMKNNLVFQMQNIIKNPSQYNKLGRAYKYYVSDIAGLTDADMPEYARNNMWLPIPVTVNRGDKETITFLKANLPPAEFGELIDSRFARGVSSLTVPLKLPIELALNRDIFTGAKIKEFPGQQDKMEPGTGFAAFMRDEQGMAVLSGDPVIQKIVSDLGGRVPARYVSTALGMVDAAAGYKDPEDAFAEALNSLGILSIREAEQIRVTNLYQALERYRNAEKLWEQKAGRDLPSKRELGLP
jgi:phosphoribosylformylglycinamidine (FGAM) synthase PurS component